MKELLEYRKALIDRLLQVAHEFRHECLAGKDTFAPLDGGWSIHQIAVHTRDVDQLVYGSRVRRTAKEENPEFLIFNGEAYMKEHYPADQPLPEILDDFVENVEELAQMLRDLPTPAWSRTSRHATLGHGFTLQAWVERDLAHIKEHLETVRKWNGR
jgi:hypothetical protein